MKRLHNHAAFFICIARLGRGERPADWNSWLFFVIFVSTNPIHYELYN
jgi:hypothetical protein